ncbi:MAG: hypothetical protein KUG77_02730 [Nannocystaceae bacterium]|nr:hypothetical protein [Nannocystaceae bacterium]
MKAHLLIPWLALAGCTPELLPGAPAPCSADRAGCPRSAGPSVDPLVVLGRANTDTFIEITDIVANGRLAYVCTAVRGLSVFDTSLDAPKRLVEKVAPGDGLSNDQFPRCQHVALDPATSRVVITNRGDEVQPQSWLALYDVADPRRPELLATWVPDTGSIEGVALVGDRLFAALHGEGVVALRLEDGALTQTGRARESDTDAWQPALAGEALVVAEGERGLRVYDVSSDEFVLRSTLALEGTSRDVLIEGDRAYVATSGGLAVVELGETPKVLAQHEVSGSPLDLAALGPRQVVVAEWDALRGYDLSEPDELRPLFSETVPTDDSFSRVLAVGAVAERGRVLGGEWTGLHAFDFVPGRGPEVEFTPGTLQFGSVSTRDARVLVVSNAGNAPLTVHDITGTSEVSVDETCFVVEPGRSKAVEVEFAPTSNAPLRSAVRICSDDPDESSVEVPLTANVSGLAVGDPAPAFALKDLEGNTWSNADLEGKVAVLAYFATF